MESEINKVMSKIGKIKEEIYLLYKSTELDEEDAKKMFGPYAKLRKSLRNPKNLVAAFILRKSAEITIEDEFITIVLPFQDEEKYGFRFEKYEATGVCHFDIFKNNLCYCNAFADLYDLKKCCLPNSMNADKEIEKAQALTLAGIAEYIKTVKRNIYAYYMRKVQFEELKAIVNLNLYFVCNFSPCYTHLKINCYYAAEKNVKHSNCVIDLRYNELDILPSEIEISRTVNDDLKQKCSVFEEEVLAVAYSKLMEEADKWLHLIHK